MNPERKRQTLALLVSLLVHALLLSLTFGGQGLGLPGFGLPWQERRAEAPALRVVLAPAQTAAAAAALPQAAVELPPDGGSALPGTPVVQSAQPTAADPATATLRAADQPANTSAPAAPKPPVIALARPDEAEWTVPPAVIAAASSAPSTPSAPSQDAALAEARERTAELARLDGAKQEAERLAQQQAQQLAQQQAQQQAAQREASRQEAAQIEAARWDAERQEAARQVAARQETARVNAARDEAARVEAAQQAAAQQAAQQAAAQQAAQQAAVQQEAVRQLAARQEAARAEAARLESERQQAAAQAAARQDAERQQAARQEAARSDAVTKLADARAAEIQAAADSREAKLRAIGRQLNEEADRRDAAAAAAAAAATASRLSPASLPATSSSARRGRLFGRTDANAELVLYAEAWSRKIQLNMGFDMVREAAKQPHTDPLVTVAIRSDGSVESVSFVRSSGVAAIDEAIRRIVLSQANYPAFQPALAREYDVVEIRRSWHFDMAIRLY